MPRTSKKIKTGIIRNLDNVGRIVLPKELRDSYGITPRTKIEFTVNEKGEIILRNLSECCCVCSESENTHNIEGDWFCEDCIIKLKIFPL